MTTAGQNDGFRILDDFPCEAIPQARATPPTTPARGVNSGASILAECDGSTAPPAGALTEGRLTALRATTTSQLLTLVRQSGSKLTSTELLAIHDIAGERWTKREDGSVQNAWTLSREVVLAAIGSKKHLPTT